MPLVGAHRLLQGARKLVDVAPAEEVHVHQEGIELVERDALVRSWRERPRFAVGVEDPRTESAEEAHHGEIDFAMPAVDRRVDEARRTSIVGVEVAAP